MINAPNRSRRSYQSSRRAVLLTAACLLTCAGCQNEPSLSMSADTDAGVDAGASGTHFSDAELRAQHCSLKASAVAYKAATGKTGVKTTGKGNAPLPCFQLTGLGSAENTLGVSSRGDIFVAPVFTAQGNGVLHSSDFGASWEPIVPTWTGSKGHARVQPFMYLDPSTDRLFFATAAGSGTAAHGFDFSTSVDQGKTWTHQNVAGTSADWVKMLSGPAVSSKTQGYPNVLYLAAPSPISTPSPFTGSPDHQAVWKSLDGGKSWASVGGSMLSLKPTDVPGCASTEWVIYGSGVVDKDGSIYLGLRRCAHLGISISRDEGATWTTRDLPGAELLPWDGNILSIADQPNLLAAEPFGVDSEGNLYALWADSGNTLQYAVSKDHGDTWSKPLAISAPTASTVRFAAIAVKAPGTIAIAYYGSSNDKDFHGYIAESTNALDAAPVFCSTLINDPKDPLFKGGFDAGYENILSAGDLIEMVEVKYAPNGDIWAAFVKDMCPGTGSACTWDKAAHANSPYQGAIGRLVHQH